jgi:hypothetical protein
MKAHLFYKRSQAALDFMVSYGMVLLVLAVAVYIVFQIGIFNPQLTPAYCTSISSFNCGAYELQPNGTFSFMFSQAIGGPIKVTGIACSSAINSTGASPQYGNIKVKNGSSYSTFYPATYYPGGTFTVVSIPSDQPTLLEVRCYDGGGLATSSVGGSFVGYIWITYTYSGLPGTHVTQQLISFSTVYT